MTKYLRRIPKTEAHRYEETYFLTYSDDKGNEKRFTIIATSRQHANMKITNKIKELWPTGIYRDLPLLIKVSVLSKKDNAIKPIYENELHKLKKTNA